MARLHHFSSFRLDTAARVLRSGDLTIPLRRKTFDLLAYLVLHPGLAIPKSELKAAVWPDVRVSDGVIRSTLKELREALGDAGGETTHVETLHGVGVRFVATVTVHDGHDVERPEAAPMVGRAAQLRTLGNRLADAVAGQRRLVLLVGEPGIGKTTVVEEFMARARHRAGGPTIARGACAEERREEALGPLLDAFTALAGPGTGSVPTSVLRRSAPLWLPLLQPQLAIPDLAAAWTGTPHRMKREGVLLLEELARAHPALVVLEDMQWADDATLAIIEQVASRAEHVPLCVVLTCRSDDGPALRRLLKLRRTTVLRLGALGRDEQLEVLRSRFGPEVASRLHPTFERSAGGHPLLMRLVGDDFIERGVLRLGPGGWTLHAGEPGEDGPPAAVAVLVDRLLDHLSGEEIEVLEAGSLCGNEFETPLISGMLERECERVEATCRSAAARSGLVHYQGETAWPDGARGERFRFRHELYREHLRRRILPSRRARLHRLAGETLERGHGGRSSELAGTLAHHFEQSGDLARAVPQLEMAAINELQRCSHSTAAERIRVAIGHLSMLPENPDRRLHMARLSHLLADLRSSVAGYADPAIETMFRHARSLFEEAGEVRGQLRTSFGLCAHLVARGLYRDMGEVSSRILELTRKDCPQDRLDVDRDECHRLCQGCCPALRTQAFTYRSLYLLGAGGVDEATRLLESALETPIEQPMPVLVDIRTVALGTLAIALAAAGRLGDSRARRIEVLDHARRSGSAAPLVHALVCCAEAAWHERDLDALARLSDEVMELCALHGFPTHALGTRVLRFGLAQNAAEGTTTLYEIEEVLRERAALGERHHDSIGHTMLVESALRLDDVASASAAVNRARRFLHESGERWMECEVDRLDGRLQLAIGDDDSAERLFRSAAARAGSQGARLWELRAVIDLAVVLERRGRKVEARAHLNSAMKPFRFEPRSADVTEAMAMLKGTARQRRAGLRLA